MKCKGKMCMVTIILVFITFCFSEFLWSYTAEEGIFVPVSTAEEGYRRYILIEKQAAWTEADAYVRIQLKFEEVISNLSNGNIVQAIKECAGAGKRHWNTEYRQWYIEAAEVKQYIDAKESNPSAHLTPITLLSRHNLKASEIPVDIEKYVPESIKGLIPPDMNQPLLREYSCTITAAPERMKELWKKIVYEYHYILYTKTIRNPINRLSNNSGDENKYIYHVINSDMETTATTILNSYKYTGKLKHDYTIQIDSSLGNDNTFPVNTYLYKLEDQPVLLASHVEYDKKFTIKPVKDSNTITISSSTGDTTGEITETDIKTTDTYLRTKAGANEADLVRFLHATMIEILPKVNISKDSPDSPSPERNPSLSNVMNGFSAKQIAWKMGLPPLSNGKVYTSSDNPSLTDLKNAGYSYEWLHLIGRKLGGNDYESNLILGSSMANSLMLIHETAIGRLTSLYDLKAHLIIKVTYFDIQITSAEGNICYPNWLAKKIEYVYIIKNKEDNKKFTTKITFNPFSTINPSYGEHILFISALEEKIKREFNITPVEGDIE